MSVPAAFIGVVLIWATTPLAIKWSSEEIGAREFVGTAVILSGLACYQWGDRWFVRRDRARRANGPRRAGERRRASGVRGRSVPGKRPPDR